MQTKDLTIREAFSLKKTVGDVGVEIELEALSALPTGKYTPTGWRDESDDSLRGYSREYVMSKPVPLEKVQILLNSLKEALDKHEAKPIYSPRAGVHVHINVQELTSEQVIRFALAYYCLDDVMTRFCGTDREGNHFCLRLRDAQYPIFEIEKMVNAIDLLCFNTDVIRYSTLNFKSLFSYGSIEFRAMASQPDLSKIYEWCDMLLRIKDYAVGLPDRKQIARDVSLLGPEGFLHSIMGDDNYKLLAYPEMERTIRRSMRLIQGPIYGQEIKG